MKVNFFIMGIRIKNFSSLFFRIAVVWVFLVGISFAEDARVKTLSSQAELIIAAGKGDLEKVKTLLDDGADINGVLEEETPLTVAIEKRKVEVVEYLLKRGADPNLVSSRYSFPIKGAISAGSIQTVRLMLKHGANVNIKGSRGYTPFLEIGMFSASRIEVLQLLIDYGARVHAKTIDGDTALHQAVIREKKSLVPWLLELGLSPNAVNEKGEAPLHLAASDYTYENAQSLIKHNADIQARNNKGRTPLHNAAWSHSPRLVKLLIDSGADVNVRDLFGKTPLYYAKPRKQERQQKKNQVNVWVKSNKKFESTKEQLETIKVLEDHGGETVEPDQQISGQQFELDRYCFYSQTPFNQVRLKSLNTTPLHLAATAGDLQRVRQLLDQGADPHILDEHKRTPLHHASEGGHVPVVALLLKEGAKLEVYDEYHRTPLLLASKRCRTKAIELLIKHGADINTRDNRSQTPLYWATYKRHSRLITFLFSKGAKFDKDKEISNLYSWADVELFKLILSKVSPQEIYREIPGALHSAARRGRVDLIRYLLDFGMDPNYQYFRVISGPWSHQETVADTPLHQAVRSGNVEAVKLLVERGAEVNFEGTSPLYWAIVYAEEEIVRYLVDQGARVYRGSPYGPNALHWILTPHFEHGTDAALGLYFSNLLPLAKLFLEKGASVNGQRIDLKTPLHLALEYNSLLKLENIFEWLLENKASPNILDKDSNTVLHMAVEGGHADLVELLLQHGADPHIKNKRGRSSLYIAKSNAETENWSRNSDYEKTFQILKKYAAAPKASTH